MVTVRGENGGSFAENRWARRNFQLVKLQGACRQTLRLDSAKLKRSLERERAVNRA